jgi:hypothetical protein
MAKSRNETSPMGPKIGTSDATSARATPVKGGTLVPRKGGKSGDPTRQPVGRRSATKETAGARFRCTETRAYADPNAQVGKNVYTLPSSHGQQDTWRKGFDGLGPEPN